MKTKLHLLFFIILLCGTSHLQAQCLHDVTLTSQAEVNNYAGCAAITGNLTINGSDITNLSPLANLTTIGNELKIQNCHNLESLNGLHNIISTGHTVTIMGNPKLKDLQGLNKLTSVGGELNIQHNPELLSLDGLDNLTSINTGATGKLEISSNQKLNNLEALRNLENMNGSIYLDDLPALQSLSGLQFINPENITYLTLRDMGSLTICNLPNFCYYISHGGANNISANNAACSTPEQLSSNCFDPIKQMQKLTATERKFAHFGYAVAIDGDYAIVGAPMEDWGEWIDGAGQPRGVAYIFKRNGKNWVLQQQLKPSDVLANSRFGMAVAIRGNQLVVGAPYASIDKNQTGAAYVYQLEGNSWVFKTRLVANDREAGDYFGWSVAVDGDQVLVGSPYESDGIVGGVNTYGSGAAYMFKKQSNGTWYQQNKLTALTRSLSAFFGWSVAINGGYACRCSRRNMVL